MLLSYLYTHQIIRMVFFETHLNFVDPMYLATLL